MVFEMSPALNKMLVHKLLVKNRTRSVIEKRHNFSIGFTDFNTILVKSDN